MGICWYCHWGWPKQVRDIYDKYLALTSETAMHYGPAHIVWEDENWDKIEHIQWCIDQAPSWMKEWNTSPLLPGEAPQEPKLTQEECDLVVQSLKELLLLPDEVLNCCPEGYDDENPELYPPPEGLVMINKYSGVSQ